MACLIIKTHSIISIFQSCILHYLNTHSSDICGKRKKLNLEYKSAASFNIGNMILNLIMYMSLYERTRFEIEKKKLKLNQLKNFDWKSLRFLKPTSEYHIIFILIDANCSK